MICTTTGLNAPDGLNENVDKYIKEVVKNDTELSIVYEGIEDGTFISFVNKDLKKKNDSHQDITLKDLSNVHHSTIKRLVKEYKNANLSSITAYVADSISETRRGFSTSAVLREAKQAVSNTIIDRWYHNTTLPKAERKTPKEIIQDTITEFKDNIDRIYNVIKSDERTKNSKTVANINKFAEENNAKIKTLNALKQEIKSGNLDAETRAAKLKEAKQLYDEIINAKNEFTKLKIRAIDELGSSADKDIVNIYKQLIQSNDFLQSVFYTPRIANISSHFKTVLDTFEDVRENEYDETDDSFEIEMDQSTARWNEKNDASFTDIVPSDLKMLFDSLYHLETPNRNGEGGYQYAYTDTIQTKIPMGYRYVTASLISKGDFTSVENLISSVEKMAGSHHSLYGLMRLADIMRNDPIIANAIYMNLSKPTVKKTIIDITSDGDFIITNSNSRSDLSSSLFYDIINNIRNTALSQYNYNDKYFIEHINGTKIEDLTDEDKQEIISFVRKYVPDLDNSILESFIDNDISNLGSLIVFASNLHSKTSTLIQKYNEFLENKDARKSKVSFRSYIGGDPYNDFTAGILNFVEKVKYYTDTRVELNSANAEGNLSSDTVNNAYIIQFTNLVNRAINGDKNASNTLIGMFANNPQFAHNPILFGVKDISGNVISNGIFTYDSNNNLIINENAKHILDVYLFDGARDQTENNSVTYKNMSKADYFITQLIQYHKSLRVAGTEIANTGLYMVKTPSDAPKQFAIRGVKYNTSSMLFVPVEEIYAKYEGIVEEQMIDNSNIEDKVVVNGLQDLNDFRIKNDKDTFTVDDFFQLITDGISITRDQQKFIDLTRNNIYTPNRGNNTFYAKVKVEAGTDAKTFVVKFSKSNGILRGSVVNYTTLDNTGTPVGINGNTANLRQIIQKDKLFNGGFQDNSDAATRHSKGIAPKINSDNVSSNEVFYAIKAHVMSELENMLHELMRIGVEKDNIITIGNGVHKDVTVYANYHTGKGGKFIENGKLLGKVFQFAKLFDIDGTSNGLFDKLFAGAKIANDGNFELNLNKKSSLFGTTVVNGEKKIIIKNRTALNEIIDKEVQDFIVRFRDLVIRESSNYESIVDGNFDANEILDFAFNQYIANMNLDSLFDGDSKFYKDAQTILKRLKQIQAGGKSHAGANPNDVPGQPITTTKDKNGDSKTITVNGATIKVEQFIDGKKVEGDMLQRNGFRAITISNTERPLKHHEELYKSLKQIYISQGVDPEIAQTLASNTVINGYGSKITADDAQSFITLEEFIRRKYADGTLNDYPNIDKLLDPNYKLTPEDYEFISKIQVQKNFYYDIYPDPRTGILIPRQIKNSEFVLIPALLKDNPHMKDLKDLYDFMKKHDIGQVNTGETSKAANTEMFEFWNRDGVRTNKENDFNPNKFVTDYYYKNLYKQQDVIDHIRDEHNKASIAFIKKFADNPDPKLQHVIDRYMEAYTANIEDDFQTLMNTMGWKQLDDGRIVNLDDSTHLDYSVFYEKARAEAARMGLDTKFLEYLTPVATETGVGIKVEPIMPNYMADNSAKLESIAQSIFNRDITRQNLPGWHGPQVSSVGVKVLDEDGNERELAYHPVVSIAEVSGSILKEDSIFAEWYKKHINSDIETLTEDADGEVYISDEIRQAYQQYVDETFTDENKPVYTEPYMEIMIPRWSGIIPRDIKIEDLIEAGLNEQIGYRVPTEGKQSITKIKVVGFINEMYGSTVIVPDGWVAQSGSDFDVDSIYAVVAEMVKGRDGKLHKIEPILSPAEREAFIKGDYAVKDEDFERRRYIQYVKGKLRIKGDALATSKFTKQDYRSLSAEFEEESDGYNSFREHIDYIQKIERDYYDNLDPILQNIIRQVEEAIKKAIEENVNQVPDKDKSKERFRNLVALAEQREGQLFAVLDYAIANNVIEESSRNEFAQQLSTYAKLQKDIFDTVQGLHDSKREYVNERLKEIAEQEKNRVLQTAENYAKQAGLKSFEEFRKYNLLEQQSKKARNNVIFDSMRAILTHPSSRAENLARSNFDHIKSAMERVAELRNESAKSRSAYNPFDQIDFMGNARSGASIKAISVTHDTHKSVCNNVKAELDPTDAIKVLYTGSKERIDAIVSSYGLSKEDRISDTQCLVPHTMYGWSLDNRNVVGELVTTYASETTAHALDVIKEGNIFNVNDYTFVLFKIMSNLGIDYDTSITYMAMPHISAIVDAYNAGNSIYISSSSNYFGQAIRTIIKPYVKNAYDYSVGNIYDAIKQIEDSTKISSSAVYQNLLSMMSTKTTDGTLSYHLNKDLHEYIIRLETALRENKEDSIKQIFTELNPAFDASKFDLSVHKLAVQAIVNAISLHSMVHTVKMFDTAKRLETLARLSNPDKFGARVSMYQTRLKLDDIEAAFDIDNPLYNTLNVKVGDNYVSYMEVLYPGFTSGKIDVDSAGYKYQAKLLQSTTMASVRVNGRLFEHDSIAYAISKTFKSFIGKRLLDEDYKKFVADLKHSAFINNPVIRFPVFIATNGEIVNYDNLDQDIKDSYDGINEIHRVFGYSSYTTFDYTREETNDILFGDNDVKRAELIVQFAKLTPSQKINWIKTNFADSGIFQYIKTRSDNESELRRRGVSRQTISINDSLEDSQTLYDLFKVAFFNKNHLIRLAALDIIKYHYIVDGGLKRNGAGKVITNDALLAETNQFGIDLVSSVKRNIQGQSNTDSQRESIDRFIRKNPSIVPIFRFKNKTAESEFNSSRNRFHGAVVIKGDQLDQPIEDDTKYIRISYSAKELLDVRDDGSPVYGKYKKQTTLYEIYGYNDTDNTYTLIPLNLLDKEDFGEMSMFQHNNIYPTKSAYIAYFAELQNGSATTQPERYIAEEFTTIEELKSVSKDDRELEQAINTLKEQALEDLADAADGYETIVVVSNHKLRYKTSKQGLKDNISNDNGDVNFNITVTQERPAWGSNSSIYTRLYNKVEEYIKHFESDESNRISFREYIEDKAKTDNNYAKLMPYVRVGQFMADQRGDGGSIAKPITTYRVKKVANTSVKLSSIPTNPYSDVDTFDEIITAKRITIEARKKWNTKHLSDAMQESIEEFNRLAIDTYRTTSVNRNLNNIYEIGAKLYQEDADYLLTEFNKFTTSDNEVYSLDDPALYENLVDNEDDANRVMYLITKMMKYGHEIESIVYADNSNLPASIVPSVKSIVDSIRRVRNNNKLSTARNLIYNVYYAKLSKHPLVQAGIISLTDIFEDTNWSDNMFSDITELNHKQIQVVVQQAYKKIEQVRSSAIPKELKSFEEQWNEIMSMDGNIDWNKIDNDGNLATTANDQFYEDRKALFDEVRKTEERNGKNSISHLRAKFARDKFLLQNTHQILESDYYKRKLEIEEKLLSEIPDLYSEYLKLRDEVYEDDRHISELNDEERLERIVKQTALYRFRKGLNIKSGELIQSDAFKKQYKLLDEALSELTRLNEEYYEVVADDNFNTEFKKNIDIITNYHTANPDKSVEYAFANDPNYAEAYEWIKNNTRVKLSPTFAEEYDKHRKTLYGDNTDLDDTDKQIFIDKKAFDEFGNPDPSKLSDDEIAAFKAKSTNGERIIKPRTPVEGWIWDDAYYTSLSQLAGNDNDITDDEKAIIASINKDLSHCIDDNGYFSWNKLKNHLGFDGLEKLARKIADYNALVEARSKSKPKTPKPKNVTRIEFNEGAYVSIINEVNQSISNSSGSKEDKDKEKQLFLRIFGLGADANPKKRGSNKKLTDAILDKHKTSVDNTIGIDSYNPLFFHYTVPYIDTKIINEEITSGANTQESGVEYFERRKNELLAQRQNKAKSKAKKWLSDNTTRIPTLAYLRAYKEAQSYSKEKFDRWFEENHYFDKKTKSYQPLPIWTQTDFRSDPKGVHFKRVPNYDNGERKPIKHKLNTDYVQGFANYNPSTGSYSDIHSLNDKELAMANFLHKTLIKHAKTNRMRTRAERGFIPRINNAPRSVGDRVRGIASLVGAQWKRGSYNWSDTIGFEFDEDPTFNMFEYVKTDESLELPERPHREYESDSEWERIMEDYERKVKEVEAHNKKIDTAVRKRDYKEIYEEYIKQSLEYNAKRSARHSIYLLMEDLKDRKALKGNPWTGKPVEVKRKSTDETRVYDTVEQTRSQQIFENWAKRFLFEQYHIGGTPRKVADSIQNFTSAKFMIGNVPGGIKNVLTGMGNVYVEVAAGQFLGKKEFLKAQARYTRVLPSMLAYTFTDNEKSTSLDEAFIKQFNVVDVEGFMLRGNDDKFESSIEKMRNLSYATQTAGEHFMQNVAMLAMTESYRIYADSKGKLRIGSENEYIQHTEQQLLERLLNEIGGNANSEYRRFINNLKRDAKRLYEVDTLKEDANVMFLKEYGDRKLLERYIQLKKENASKVKQEFEKLTRFRDAFELRDGRAEIKDGIGLTDDHIAEFVNKVKSVNKKIHGVYDKLGAAQIEKEWYGSLVMQYHKHIYPGIMKRFRIKGYYNEHRNTFEVGMYPQLARLLSTSWKDAVNEGKLNRKEANALQSVGMILLDTLNFVNYVRINYQIAPEWQRANMRRIKGDMFALLVPIALKMMMNFMWDDDEIDDDIMLSNIEYALRAHYQEMLGQHAGLAGESSALYTRPIAALTTFTDLAKLAGYITDSLFDENYNPKHRSGRHKGENKINQIIRSNIPGLRNYDRFVNMPKNNSYYRKGASNFQMPDIDVEEVINEYSNDNSNANTVGVVDSVDLQ